MFSPSATNFSINELEQNGCNPDQMIVPAIQMSKKYEQILIETTKDQLERIRFEYTSKSVEDQKKYFKETFDNLNEVSLEILMKTPRTDSLWINWKEQLLIFYLCRYLLLKKEVPILVLNKEL